MWNLCDEVKYKKLFNFDTNKIYTYGGNNKEQDKKNREDIREKAINTEMNQVLKNRDNKNKSYAFRISIYINKTRCHRPDIDNTVKLIVDSFSKSQLDRDSSKYPDCWFYEDDCYPNVKVIEVGVVKEVNSKDDENMHVEIFECL
jgi:Holliday junction resolvase RusA-like endonuclease